jgi:hypothetical protein
MPDSPAPRPPAVRIDRASLERVLARAAELQGLSSDSSDVSDQFSEEQLIELGKEVGLSPDHLRQALAEERTRSVVPEQEHGIAASLFGPGLVYAARTVPGKSADVLAAIDRWMQEAELLVVKRHHGNRIVWERRPDVLLGIKRALKAGGRDYALSNAHEVSATVLDVGDDRVHVVLDGDLRNQRVRARQQAIGSAGFGVAVGGALAVMGIMAAVAAAPAIAMGVGGFTAARAYQRRIVTRAQLALDQLLDRLERGELSRRGTNSLLGAIIGAATSSIPPRRF